MTLDEFCLLPENEQTDLVWEGRFMFYREEKTATILLYKVFGFYVEVHYHTEKTLIIQLVLFRSQQGLAPYFELCPN